MCERAMCPGCRRGPSVRHQSREREHFDPANLYSQKYATAPLRDGCINPIDRRRYNFSKKKGKTAKNIHV